MRSQSRTMRRGDGPRVIGEFRGLAGAVRERVFSAAAVACLCVTLSGCVAPIGADKSTPTQVYRQTHDNAVSHSTLSPATLAVLQRYGKAEEFRKSPDATLKLIHQKAVETRERGLLFALSELSYLTGDRARRGVRDWDRPAPSDYYLASAVYAWFFLLGDAADPAPDGYDKRFRTACDLYNYGLSRGLTSRDKADAAAVFESGTRLLPIGEIELHYSSEKLPLPLGDFETFVYADQFRVRGLTVRNRQPGMGAPMIGITKPDPRIALNRCVGATAFLRVEGGVADLTSGRCKGTLELYPAHNASTVQVGDKTVPLEADTTVSVAFLLNQSFLWTLGMRQFFSFEERMPTDIYLTQPYVPGKIPVVFIHGTFSSPVWWAEMVNTLSADAELRKRFQFWQFVYNSGNPTSYSAVRLREALNQKLKALDPEGKDPALRDMVVVGHSQGGLLAKMTATDTGEKLLQVVLKTNRVEDVKLSPKSEAVLRKYTCFEPLPYVKRVVFISTPHRGSYLAGGLARRLAHKFVTLPSTVVNATKEFTGLSERKDLPAEFKGTPTSLDSMSPKNRLNGTLADIPIAPGVKGHSIIAVKGNGDYREGKDGLVKYSSAHVDYVESELIVRASHSCQSKPETIEEVRRILHEHLKDTPPATLAGESRAESK